MAIINKNTTYMALPSSIKRGNPFPLDTTAVWYDEALMKDYAATSVVAYVGQVLTLVDETNNSAKAFIIMDTAGNLQEVGSATLGDNKAIVLDDAGVLALKNWGVQYYKWVEGETEGEGEHVLVTVDETNPWIAGLEPKVATGADGVLELAWYQPSTLTVEGVSSAVSSIQTTVNNLTQAIGTAEDAAGANTVYGAINEVKESNEALAGKLDTTGGVMTGDLVLADGSKAASETVVDTKVAEAVASAGHLKREIVEALPAVEDADKDTIYMVKSGLALTGDKYIEYMLIDGAFEQIGDTSVDLSNYIQKIANPTEGDIAMVEADGTLIGAGLAVADVKAHLEDTDIHVTADEKAAWNEAKAVADANAEAIAAMPEISAENAEKLANMPAITEIGDNLVLENGILTAVAEQYELPVASADTLGGVKIGAGLAIEEEVVAVKVDETAANGLSVGADGLALAIATTTSAGAMSAAQALKLENLPANAQANLIEGLLLGANEVAAEINDDKKLLLPFATADIPGVVVSSDADNAIAVHAATGVMTLNRVSTSKLYVPDGEELILDGGDSNV